MKRTLYEYNLAGLGCLPVKKDKSPDVKTSWKPEVKDDSLYENAYGIGICCGEVSGRLEVIDFDNHFGDAKQVISEFMTDEVKEIYNRYTLPVESTMSGGYHLLYRCSVISGNQKLASRPKLNEQGKWIADVLIETRGEGGYIVSAPTPGYKILKGSFMQIPEITPEERNIILEKCKSFNTWNNSTPTIQEEKDRPGDIFNSKSESFSEMVSALTSVGWNEKKKGEWTRPGKKEGISATLGRVAPGVFYVFSSSAYPFEPNKAYTPFQVIALLKHNGDFSAFAKELANRYNINPEKRPVDRDYKPKEKQVKTVLDFDSVLDKSLIDITIPVAKPPIIMRIRNRYGVEYKDTRLFTLGNFSAITGKGKSKKTFLTRLLAAAAVSNHEVDQKFVPYIPRDKNAVLMFDTEQGEYDCYVNARGVYELALCDTSHFGFFSLREYTPIQRCEIIEYALEKYKDSVSFVVIDGIADLATAINDEEEATRVGSLLLRWTKQYNVHICTVIHQNKSNDMATGHIGSMIIKKAEVVIAVEKNNDDKSVSTVKCDLIRGAMEFEEFSFSIDDNGKPYILYGDMPMVEKSDRPF